jgi:hypothetical protein
MACPCGSARGTGLTEWHVPAAVREGPASGGCMKDGLIARRDAGIVADAGIKGMACDDSEEAGPTCQRLSCRDTA